MENKLVQFIYAHTKEGWDSEYRITCFNKSACVLDKNSIEGLEDRYKKIFDYELLKNDYNLDNYFEKAYVYYKGLDEEGVDTHFFGQVALRDDTIDNEETRPKTKTIEHFFVYNGNIKRPYKFFVNSSNLSKFITKINEKQKLNPLDDLDTTSFLNTFNNDLIYIQDQETVKKILIAIIKRKERKKNKIILVNDDINKSLNDLFCAYSLLPSSLLNGLNFYTFQKKLKGLSDFPIICVSPSYFKLNITDAYTNNIVIDTRIHKDEVLENFEKLDGSRYVDEIFDLITNRISDQFSEKLDYIDYIFYTNNVTCDNLDELIKLYKIMNNCNYNVKPFYSVVLSNYKKEANRNLPFSSRLEVKYIEKLLTISNGIDTKTIELIKDVYFCYEKEKRNKDEKFVELYERIFINKFFRDNSFIVTEDLSFVMDIIEKKIINDIPMVYNYIRDYCEEISIQNIFKLYEIYAKHIMENDTIEANMIDVTKFIVKYCLTNDGNIRLIELLKGKPNNERVISIILDATTDNKIIDIIEDKIIIQCEDIVRYIDVFQLSNSFKKECLKRMINKAVQRFEANDSKSWEKLINYRMYMKEASKIYNEALIIKINNQVKSKNNLIVLESVRNYVKQIHNKLSDFECETSIIINMYEEINFEEKAEEDKEIRINIKKEILSNKVNDFICKTRLINDKKVKRIQKKVFKNNPEKNRGVTREEFHDFLLEPSINKENIKTKEELTKLINSSIEMKDRTDRFIVNRKVIYKRAIVSVVASIVCSIIGIIELLLCLYGYQVLEKNNIIVNHFNYLYFWSVAVIFIFSFIYGFLTPKIHKIGNNVLRVIRWNMVTTFIPILLMIITSLLLYLYI